MTYRTKSERHVYIAPGFWRRVWAIFVACFQDPLVETVIHQGDREERW